MIAMLLKLPKSQTFIFSALHLNGEGLFFVLSSSDLLWPCHPFILSSPVTEASFFVMFLSSCTFKVNRPVCSSLRDAALGDSVCSTMFGQILGCLPKGFTFSEELVWFESKMVVRVVEFYVFLQGPGSRKIFTFHF